MAFTLNLNEFWEKIVFSENQDLEQRVYILHQFCSKIRKEFFKNNFMPFLKDLAKLIGDIEKIFYNNSIFMPINPFNSIDINDIPEPEILMISKNLLKEILIEGNKRWSILLETSNFNPDTNNGSIRITMPNSSIGFYISFSSTEEKKYIMFKDIGIDSLEEWHWDLEWEYDIPKETIKHILKERISNQS